jgi:predicted transcriptional regulator
MILKALFSSQTRIKLLKNFLSNEEEEFYIRELTRLLDEQINSIRRELDNLKKIGLVKSRLRNRRKFFTVNTNFLFYNELKNIFIKTSANDKNLKKDLSNLGKIDLAILSGNFVNNKETETDILIVGEIVSKKVEDYFLKDYGKNKINHTVLTKADFLYRLEVKDPFLFKILKGENNVFLINKVKDLIKKYL